VIELGAVIPASILMMVGIIAAAWCVIRGSTIGASAMVEKPETSIWGLILNTTGILILIYGFITALMVMMPQMPPVLTLLAVELLVATMALIVWVAKGMRTNTSIEQIFPRVTHWAAGCGIAVIISLIIWNLFKGGGVGTIPESAWPLLLGAVTMLGAAFAAALCIMVAVRSGSAAMVEKPELSIWSLLFVALGEGLAIYGLIVALLIVMA